MPFRTLLVAAAAAVCLPAVAGDEPLSAVGSSRGLGLELAVLEREGEFSTDAGDSAFDAQGSVGGLYGYLQRGAAFRAEGRILRGSLDYESSVGATSESVTYGELRATWGTATPGDWRLYAGAGIERLWGDSPLGGGDASMRTAYVPFGFATAGNYYPAWRALVTVEGRFVVDGVDEIDAVPGIGDAEFDRSGGWGAELSVLFRHATAGVEVKPYVSYVAPSDSDTENVGGTDVRLEDIEHVAGGVRVTWFH